MMWGYGNGPGSMMMGWMAPLGMITWVLILALIVLGLFGCSVP